MNRYKELERRQEREFKEFSSKNLLYAFTNEQLEEGLNKLNLTMEDTDKIVSLGAGAFILKDKVEEYKQLSNKHRKELEDAIKADTTGEGFIYEMFLYVLVDYEYIYTEDATDALDALGITIDQLEMNKPLKNGLLKAMRELLEGE